MCELLHPFAINSTQISSFGVNYGVFLLVPYQVHYILCKHYGTYVPRYICEAAILLKSCMQIKAYAVRPFQPIVSVLSPMILKPKALWGNNI